jgi:hypothetical protein
MGEAVLALQWCVDNSGECLGDWERRLAHTKDVLARVRAAMREAEMLR